LKLGQRYGYRYRYRWKIEIEIELKLEQKPRSIMRSMTGEYGVW